jgi:hypothetical protein
VSKSGSPALKLTRSRPAALSAFAFAAIVNVGDGSALIARSESLRVSASIIVIKSPYSSQKKAN